MSLSVEALLLTQGVRVVETGPLTSAPAASLHKDRYYYDDTTKNLYQSDGYLWGGVSAWLTVGGVLVALNGALLNVDVSNLQIRGFDGLVLGASDMLLGAE